MPTIPDPTIDLDAAPELALPDQVDEHTVECLNRTRVGSFTADPPVLQPFSGQATLRWTVATQPGCSVGITLNGQAVAKSGVQRVHPTSTTRYTLGARMKGTSRVLDSVVVRVDTSACVTRTVPESVIRTTLQRAVDEFDRASGRVSQRSTPRVEVEPDGIHVALRFKVAIDNFADPDLDVDLVVGLRVRNGAVEPFYRRFDVDVDWPWWVTGISAGASKIVEEFLDDQLEARLRPRLLATTKARIDALVDALRGDLRLHSLRLATNEIAATACPSGPELPFLVI